LTLIQFSQVDCRWARRPQGLRSLGFGGWIVKGFVDGVGEVSFWGGNGGVGRDNSGMSQIEKTVFTPPPPPRHYPRHPSHLIDDQQALLALCDALRAAGSFTFDTEFIGESSYEPLLCLIQVATKERIELVDPLADLDLMPLWELIADPLIEKIVHAGEQDMAIVFQRGKLAPANVVDAQLAAGFVDLGYPVAYRRLVEHYCGVSLAKAHTYSAWDRRPLSDEQFEYAADDVKFLPHIWDCLRGEVAAVGKLSWLTAACDDATAAAARAIDPQTVYRKLKGTQNLNSEQLAVLRAATAFREQLAFEHDLPARSMLKDEVLIDLGTRMPKKIDGLLKIRGMPEDIVQSYGSELLEVIAAARALPDEALPRAKPMEEETFEMKRLGEQLWVIAQMLCVGQGVSTAMVTSQAEMAGLARLMVQNAPRETWPLMTGWVGECLGGPLVAMVQGGRAARAVFDRALRVQVIDGE
jgi:ribonuclease D